MIYKMTVKDFIQLGDVKQTIEKEVARKPTIEELTTVEVPGRPSPAIQLESRADGEGKKFIRKRKREKSDRVSAVKPEKNSVLIITEKPQAAMKIASALGNARKIGNFGVSYYDVEKDGKNISVASAVGHLYNLTYKKGQSGWPIFEIEWEPSYEKKNAEFTKKYLELLKKLALRAEEIVLATDFDVEGEVIGWNVLRFACKRDNAKRMKFSTLTSEELRKSYEKPLTELNWGNAYAGEARHILDWLYGINLSRALMSAIKLAGSFKILSIGRVQGPALKIIVDREKEIMNFKPVPYWQVFAYVQGDNTEFKHPRDIFEEEALEIFKGIKKAVAETKKNEERLQPLHPFDLTTLQKEAYKFYKINPSETLAIAQKLYLDGIISYPRTSSQKIPEAIEPRKIIKSLGKQFPEAKYCTRDNPIEGKKSDPAHPSIYPTGELKQLSGREEKIYNLIARRFLAAFAPDAIIANTRVILSALGNNGEKLMMKSILEKKKETDDDEENGEDTGKNKTEREYAVTFTASAQAILEKGWLQVYPYKIEEGKIAELNGNVIIEKINFEKKETQPPNRYTPASLVSILEKKNLGTKATRSSIVETLFDRGYLDGQSIKATPLGMGLIETLEKHSSIIIDENLTRKLEEEMEQIQNSTEGREGLEKKEKAIVDSAKRIITDISKEFRKNEREIGEELLKGLEVLRDEQKQNNTLMQCPKCRKGMLRILYSKKSRRYFVACSAYPECRQTFSLPPNSLIKKADKTCESDQFPKLLAIRKGKRPWEFCFNPQCPIEIKKREEWNNRNEKSSGN